MDDTRRKEIARALHFISANLTHPITVADVARAAHLSEFHLHRVFHAAVGESIGRFITRQRLELAALRLAYEPDRSITDIALSSGYSSSSNFTKAFTSYFGVSPSEVRLPKNAPSTRIGQLTARYGRDFRPDDLYTLPPERGTAERKREAERWDGQVRFETSEGQTFASLASTTGYDPAAVEQTWVELITRARQLGIAEGPVDAWGMAHDSPTLTAPELCRYHASIPHPPGPSLPAPLFETQMQPGRYAVFDYQGDVFGVAEAYRSIYSCWFPESSVAPDDFVPLDHYVDDFPKDGQVTLELWFKIRPRG